LEGIDKRLLQIETQQQNTMEKCRRVCKQNKLVTLVVYVAALLLYLSIPTIQQKFKLYFFSGLAIFSAL